MAGSIGGRVSGAVAIEGSLMYLGVGDQLQVLDLADPYVPKLRGTAGPLPADIEGIAVRSGVAAVAVGPAGLATIDVARPDAPSVRGLLALPGYARAVAFRGEFAVVADGPAGLRVVGLSDPAKAVEVASVFPAMQALDVVVVGGFAYAAGAGSGLLVADLTDPVHPKEAATLDMTAYAYGVDVSGELVYLADAWDGLGIVDVSAPTAPRAVGTLEVPGWALRVRVSGDRAYIAAGAAGLQLVDLRDPRKPALVGGEAGLDHMAVAVAARDRVAYLVEPTSGVRIFDTAGDMADELAGYAPIGTAVAVALSGGRAILGALSYGARLVDVRDPPRLVQTFSLPTAQRVAAVAATSSAAYLITEAAEGGPLASIFRVDPSTGTTSAPRHFRYQPRDITARGDLMYVAGEVGLAILGTTDEGPCEMSFLETFRFGDGTGFQVISVAVAGSFAYTTGLTIEDEAVLAVFDVSDARSPTLVGRITNPKGKSDPAAVLALGPPRGLLASRDALYSVMDDRLQIWSLADPKAPALLGGLTLPARPGGRIDHIHSLAFHRGHLLVADGRAGVIAVDVSRPLRPRIAGRLRLPGAANAIAVDERYAYVASLSGGLYVVELREASSASDVRDAAATEGRPPGLTALAPGLVPQPGGSTCVVVSREDSGPGTLRDCVGRTLTRDVIRFDTSLFPPTAPASIHVASPIRPAGGVTLDASGAGVILDCAQRDIDGIVLTSDYVVIRGLQILHCAHGLGIEGSENVVEGSVLSGNRTAGIEIRGPRASANRIVGNFIGTDESGERVVEPQGNGILLANARGNRIGGPTDAERNVIAGSVESQFNAKGAVGNRIEGNSFGLDRSGTREIGRAAGGVDVLFDFGSSGNVFVGNDLAGFAVANNGSTFNEFVGNRGPGIIGTGDPFTRIGGLRPGEGNAVGDVSISASDSIVVGNLIGIAQGGARLGQGGLLLNDGASRNTIGGVSAAERNVIVGDAPWGGVRIIDRSAFNVVMGNAIGTDRSGSRRLSDGTITLGPSYRNFVIGNDLAAPVTILVDAEENVVTRNRTR